MNQNYVIIKKTQSGWVPTKFNNLKNIIPHFKSTRKIRLIKKTRDTILIRLLDVGQLLEFRTINKRKLETKKRFLYG